jgi:streptogramin lyase
VTFQPSLAAAPVSLILPILYTGGILANSLGLSVDANGTVWVGSGASGRRNGFSTAGVPLSSAGFADDLTGTEYAVAVDPAGDTWAIDENSSLLSELSESGQVIGATSLFTAAQLDQPFAVSFDHFGLIWVADDNGVTQLLPGGGVTMKVAIPSFSGDGIADVEVDGLGNIWGTNFDNNTIVKLLPSGVPAFGLAGVGGGGLFSPQGIAFDANNDVWVGNANGTSVSKFANSGYPLSPTGFFGGGVAGSRYVAVDGDGHVWTPSSSDGVIGEFDNSGNPICATGFPIVPGGTGFWGVAIDGSGNVWSTSLNGGLVQLVGAAAPVITPLSVASKNNMLGTRP